MARRGGVTSELVNLAWTNVELTAVRSGSGDDIEAMGQCRSLRRVTVCCW